MHSVISVNSFYGKDGFLSTQLSLNDVCKFYIYFIEKVRIRHWRRKFSPAKSSLSRQYDKSALSRLYTWLKIRHSSALKISECLEVYLMAFELLQAVGMKKGLSPLLAFFFICSGQAQADSSSDALSGWTNIFPAPLSLKDLRSAPLDHVLDYLAIDPACKLESRGIVELVKRFDAAAKSINGQEAEKIFLSIQDTIRKSGKQCEAWDQLAYLLASRIISVSTDLMTPLLAAFLANQGSIRFSNSALGSRAQPFLGTYDCNQTKIVIDASLHPYDIGGVLTHELSHLLRDKLTPLNTIKGAFSSRNSRSGIDWPAFLTTDEALAVSGGAFQEWHIESAHSLDCFAHFIEHSKTDGDAGCPYRLDFSDEHAPLEVDAPRDLNLVSLDGAVASLFGAEMFESWDGLAGFILEPSKVTSQIVDVIHDAAVRIFSLVHSAYFKSGQLSRKEMQNLTSRHLPAELEPNQYQNGSWDDFRVYMQRLSPLLSRPSDTCKALIAASQDQAEQDLRSYIGLSNGSPVQPGEDGVRPSRGLRVCLARIPGL
jgi:hypothetical protein